MRMEFSFQQLLFACVVALGVWCSLPSSSEAVLLNRTLGDVTVQQLPFLTKNRNYHGYVEYRFRVTNTSTSQQHKITLGLQGRALRYDHLNSITRSAVLSPRSTNILSLHLPYVSWSGQGINVTVDDGEHTGFYYINHVHHYYMNNHVNSVNVLVSSAFTSRAIRHLNGVYKRRTRYGKIRYYSYWRFRNRKKLAVPYNPWYQHRYLYYYHHRTEHQMTLWYQHWRSYTGYDGVLLTGKEWARAPESVQQALTQYVEAGGSLFVLGAWKAPSHWKTTPNKDTTSSAVLYNPSLGRVVTWPTYSMSRFETIPASELNFFYAASYDTLVPWRLRFSASLINNAFPVVKNIQMPVRGIFFLLLLFSLLIGPINLWVLNKRNKRILMFVSVPVLALAASLLIFFYAIFSEGWSGFSRTTSFTYLDQTSRRAITLGWRAYYFPLSPSGGLKFDPNTEVISQITFSSSGLARGKSLHWTQGQHLKSGWFLSRVPMHLRIRKVEQRRERLEISTKKNGSLVLVNGLGAKIRKLWIRGKNGKHYVALNVAAGARVTLQPSPVTLGTPTRRPRYSLRRVYMSTWVSLRKTLEKNPQEFLKENTYIAVLEGAPFVEPGTKINRSKRQDSVVLGRFKGGSNAG